MALIHAAPPHTSTLMHSRSGEVSKDCYDRILGAGIGRCRAAWLGEQCGTGEVVVNWKFPSTVGHGKPRNGRALPGF